MSSNLETMVQTTAHQNFVMLFANVHWNDGFGKHRFIELPYADND